MKGVGGRLSLGWKAKELWVMASATCIYRLSMGRKSNLIEASITELCVAIASLSRSSKEERKGNNLGKHIPELQFLSSGFRHPSLVSQVPATSP